VLRIFGHMREEVVGWRRLHNDKLHNSYALPNIKVIVSRKGGCQGM